MRFAHPSCATIVIIKCHRSGLVKNKLIVFSIKVTMSVKSIDCNINGTMVQPKSLTPDRSRILAASTEPQAEPLDPPLSLCRWLISLKRLHSLTVCSYPYIPQLSKHTIIIFLPSKPVEENLVSLSPAGIGHHTCQDAQLLHEAHWLLKILEDTYNINIQWELKESSPGILQTEQQMRETSKLSLSLTPRCYLETIINLSLSTCTRKLFKQQ